MTQRDLEPAQGTPARLGSPGSVGVLMSEVRRVELRWLWPGRLPLGKICVLDGDPGVGKSSFTLDLAARISSGRPFPDGTPCDPSGVVILSAEDDLGDTVSPRLEAAGARMEVIRAVHLLGQRGHERLPEFPDDLPRIEEAIRSVRAGLVIIDPFMAYLSAQVDAHKDQHVRRALAPLAQMAMRNHCAVLLVRHLRKSVDGPALYRGGGSIGIIAAARTGLFIGKHPQNEGERVLAVNKSNLATRAASLIFRIEAAGNSSSRVEWLGESELTAEELTGSPLSHQTGERLQEAVDFLQAELAESARLAVEVVQAAREAGIGERTLRRARAVLDVRARRHGTSGKRGAGAWIWELSDSGGHALAPQSVDALIDGSEGSPDLVAPPNLAEAVPSESTQQPDTTVAAKCASCGSTELMRLGPGYACPNCHWTPLLPPESSGPVGGVEQDRPDEGA